MYLESELNPNKRSGHLEFIPGMNPLMGECSLFTLMNRDKLKTCIEESQEHLSKCGPDFFQSSNAFKPSLEAPPTLN